MVLNADELLPNGLQIRTSAFRILGTVLASEGLLDDAKRLIGIRILVGTLTDSSAKVSKRRRYNFNAYIISKPL
jgi:hypothetical protein